MLGVIPAYAENAANRKAKLPSSDRQARNGKRRKDEAHGENLLFGIELWNISPHRNNQSAKFLKKKKLSREA
jgi:hypothetical protein